MTRLLRSSGPLLATLLVLLLGGCDGVRPYRTAVPTAPLACETDAGGQVPAECRSAMLERTANYDLLFTEFTDQGLLFPPTSEFGEAHRQIDFAMERLGNIAKESGYNGISLLVFVHGWKHNAHAEDDNVRRFRTLLHSAALFEQASAAPRRVVGVYVGWRGRSLIHEPLNNLTFWTRKSTALRVAQGSPRELFNRLRSFKCAQNQAVPGQASEPGVCGAPPGTAGYRPKVRMIMIGHSFGAWVLYNAVAGSLVESLTYETDNRAPGATNPRFADMIVLLNPAFEAARYLPLHRIATDPDTSYPRYQPPILVSVTTSADVATRVFFPLGRSINSVFEHEASREEGQAITHTMGHIDDYISHRLDLAPEAPAECAAWKPLRLVEDPALRPAQARSNRDAEAANTGNFPGMRTALDPGWTRTFCGRARLSHVRHHANSVIWNVRTDATIMRGHNDIDNDTLFEFLRQLYHDSVLYPLPTRAPNAPLVVRQGRPPPQ